MSGGGGGGLASNLYRSSHDHLCTLKWRKTGPGRGRGELARLLDRFCLRLTCPSSASPALDVQSCGVTTEGAEFFQEILKLNTCLIVLDLRGNSLIGEFNKY